MNKGIPKVPIHGKAAHNAAFLVSIGNLVVNWSNNESVFLAMLQVLIRGGEKSAAIVWHSHRTSNGRLDLVHRLCREQIANTEVLSDITDALNRFKNLSRTRNFYCHALYQYDANLNLRNASGATSPQEGDPLVFENKSMNRATLNEIGHISMELGALNRKLWKLVDQLQTELGVQLVKLPQLPAEPTQSPNDQPHQDEG